MVDEPVEEHASSVRDRAVGALVGLAVGDAVGTTLEFKPRDSYEHITDMVGGGPFGLEPGQWTDDTSMALCLADTLLEKGQVDQADLMGRFVRWWRQGENSSTGTCFDIGMTTSSALLSFERSGEPVAGSTDERSAGNGSLMRLAPVAVLYHRSRVDAETAARAQSVTTHAAPAAVDACAYFAGLLVNAINGKAEQELLRPEKIEGAEEVQVVAAGSWRDKRRDEIRSTGYVIHTLEAALWSVANSGSFEEAVLLAANLGDDADTVAAVTGQLAGALWGTGSIPEDWKRRLTWSDTITEKACALFDAGRSKNLEEAKCR